MKKSIEARIIGETSAGMTALEIYVNDELYWSHDYFAQGATEQYYREALRKIYEDAMDCVTVEEWAEWEYDAEGDPIIEDYDTSDTTWIVASYKPETGWTFAEPTNDGQSYHFIEANADRIPAEVIESWTDFLGIEEE
jgi:hypothetical protein